MTLWQENLTRLVALIDRKQAEVELRAGQLSALDNYSEWRRRRNEAEKELIDFFSNVHDARFLTSSGSGHIVRMAGIRASSTIDWQSALRNWRRAAIAKHGPFEEDDCPGHVASDRDPKVCGYCGSHVDSLRPPDDDGFNPHGSGPVPIEPREG